MSQRLHEQRHRDRLPVGAATAIHARRGVDRVEQVIASGDVLGRSQEQPALRPQRIMEYGNQPLLQTGVEIDQQIAADDQIHAREGRILDQVVVRHPHHVADALDQSIIVITGEKITVEQFRRDFLDRALRVGCGARLQQHLLVNVGGENLHRWAGAKPSQRL